ASGEGQVGAEITAETEARFGAVMDVVVDGIEQGSFPANPGAETWDRGRWAQEHCTWCDFEPVCPTTRGGAWVQLRTRPELRPYVELAEDVVEPDGTGGGVDG